ncbi:MAG: formate dehydrogenase, partial [Planctomycetota bacterium]
MPYKPKRSLIERAAEAIGLIRENVVADDAAHGTTSPSQLRAFPDPSEWSNFVELDPRAWPRERCERRYQLVPTVCFNCESACGLLAYVDKCSGRVRKFEGNPLHPGSRGKNCAKGPATINQINDPDRILKPMKRTGPRGGGQWREVSWDDALQDIGGRIREALQENRRDEIVYHVGRPGSEGFVDRVLRAWGVDGHNSHTNICSAGARFGYAIWSGYDRPSPDYANARFILALNAHFESGHYFNPHAQRIREGMAKGCKLAVVDPRLSNTASQADFWLPTKPGTEAALLLAFASVILRERLYDRAFIERWVNWRDDWRRPSQSCAFASVDEFLTAATAEYARFTPEFAATECGLDAEQIRTVAHLIADAGSRFCSHTWRGAASAHLGGWQVSRCLFFLHVLTGSVGTVGGTAPSAWHKFKADLINPPPPQDHWNELHWPREFPLTHYELSQLLPHFLKDGRGKIDVYFTRVFNPVWTYPDGFTWIEALRDESKIGLHVALTPTWNETAFFADYVLPMGHGPERHDLTTYETHSSSWIAFRQPVRRVAARNGGDDVPDSRHANPGQVWEEDEFWIALCWAIDPDGALGIRQYFQSPTDSGRPLTVDEYYAHIFDRVPGLSDAAAAAGQTPLEYMRSRGAFEVHKEVYEKHERRLGDEELAEAHIDPDTGVVRRDGKAVGVRINGEVVEGFPTPSRKLEFFSPTLAEWGWPEYAIPGYIVSHVWEAGPSDASEVRGAEETDDAGAAKNVETSVSTESGHGPSASRAGAACRLDACLLPTFRLPT